MPGVVKKVEAEATPGSVAPETAASGANIGNSLKRSGGKLKTLSCADTDRAWAAGQGGKHSCLAGPLQVQGRGHTTMEVLPLW